MKILASCVLLLALAIPAFSEMIVHTKDGRAIRVAVDASEVASIEFVSGVEGSAARNISGAWYSDDTPEVTNNKFSYSQVGNRITAQGSFSYQGRVCRWNGTGTINGDEVEYSVNYHGTHPAGNAADGKQVLALSPDGMTLTGTWYNNGGQSGRITPIKRR